MTRFGHRVVGHHAAQKEQILRRTHGRKFGPRVIGKVLQDKHDLAAAEAEKEAPATSRAQERVRKAEKAAADAEAARSTVTAGKEMTDVSMTIDQLEASLASDPTMYEDLFATEKARTGGPRKGGLRVLLAHELANDNRPERLEEIQKLLG